MSRHFGARGPFYQTERARAIIALSVCSVIFFGALSFYLVSSKGSGDTGKKVEVVKEAPVEKVEVLIPVQQIEAGRPLEPALFRRELRGRVGLSPKVIKSFEEIKGFYARTLILPDQPLHSDYITKVRPMNEIIQQIPEGYRAVSIRVDVTSSVEGWVRPGARVDVIWASRINGKSAVSTIVENAKVLSVERDTRTEVKAGSPVPSTVTLLVPAEDSKKIQLALTTGTLSLSLRGDSGGSKASGTNGTITIDDLINGGRSSQGPAVPQCSGRVKTCSNDGRCETLCLRADGSMVPLTGGD